MFRKIQPLAEDMQALGLSEEKALTEDAGDVTAYFDLSKFFEFSKTPAPTSEWMPMKAFLEDVLNTKACRAEIDAVVKKWLAKYNKKDQAFKLKP